MPGIKNGARQHFPALDGLRGVAILLVILTHVSTGWWAARSIFDAPAKFEPTFHVWWRISAIAEAGSYGVQLFFIVSAFTLTATRQNWIDKGLAYYAGRRIARVGPGYWLAGIAYTVLAGTSPRLWAPHGVSPLDFVIAALFGSAWQGGASWAVVPGGWSVSVEVSFYIVLPFFLRVIRGRVGAAVLCLVASAILAQVIRPWLLSRPVYAYQAFCFPLAQLPAFMCGIVAALAVERWRVLRLPGAAYTALGLAVFVVAFKELLPPAWLLMPLIPFSVLCAAATALSAAHPPLLLRIGVARKVGEVSYSMYLVHFGLLFPSLQASLWLFPGAGLAAMLMHFGLTSIGAFGISLLTHRFIEQPPSAWVANTFKSRQQLKLALQRPIETG